MKLTESQIRQVIREELEVILNEMHGQEDSEKPGIGFSGKQVAGMAAAGVLGNVAFDQIQRFLHTHPEWLAALKAAMQAVGQALSENKSNK